MNEYFIKPYLYVKTSITNKLTMKRSGVCIHPLIWENGGLYGLISVQQINNALRVCDFNSRTHLAFYWDEVIPVLSEVAKALLGEQELNNCDNSSTEETQ